MEGSEKQVKWALKIQRGVLAHLDRIREPGPGQAWTEVDVAHLEELRLAVEELKSAEWWIDHRHDLDLGSLAGALLGAERCRVRKQERRAAHRAARQS